MKFQKQVGKKIVEFQKVKNHMKESLPNKCVSPIKKKVKICLFLSRNQILLKKSMPFLLPKSAKSVV